MGQAVHKLEAPRATRKTPAGKRELIDKLRENRSQEFVFAVVGYAGSGTSYVAELLEKSLRKKGFTPHHIKARLALDTYAKRIAIKPPEGDGASLERTAYYQELGDKLRNESREYGFVAAYMVSQIKSIREEGKDQQNVYLLDSLKHPDEVALLRHVYGANFFLIGVGCRPDIRQLRLQKKYHLDGDDPADQKKLKEFIGRDAEDSEHKYGQQVNDTFHLSDYFVDNTKSSENTRIFTLPDQLKRLEDIVLRNGLCRPSLDERGMYHAQAASMRSACLSRQVGASVLDAVGNVLAVGANEVPKAGGGAYEEASGNDHRCFQVGYCSNTQKQNDIINEIYAQLTEAGQLGEASTAEKVAAALKKTRVKSLIEFSRAVHAEMDALMSMVRSGTQLTPTTTLYSTTYPCHNCARHIVAAGVMRVMYLEPYAKSLAISLHDDSIADNLPSDEVKGRVEFLPYEGVSPRLYGEVFLKRADLKKADGTFDYDSSAQFKNNERSLWTKTYVEFENEVMNFITEVEEMTANEV